MIKNLRWHLNPPTPSMYLNVADPLIDASTTTSSADHHDGHQTQTSYEISELSRYLLELSVCDGYFSDKAPSSIAHASILVAMEHHYSRFGDGKIETRFRSYQLDKMPRVTEECAQRLRHVYGLAMATQAEEDDEPRAGSSPTSVLHGGI